MPLSQLFAELFQKFTAGALLSSLGFLSTVQPVQPINNPEAIPDLKRFASCSELKDRIAKSANGYAKGMPVPMRAITLDSVAGQAPSGAAESAASRTDDFSRTNVQVEGVDEADIIKNDGKFVYHLTRNRLAISSVYPVESTKMLSITNLGSETQSFQPTDLYVEGDRVMLIGNAWENQVYPQPRPLDGGVNRMIMPIWRDRTLTVAQIWDVKDRTNPKQLRTVEFDGSMVSTRLVNGRVYFVLNAWTPWQNETTVNETSLVPSYRDSQTGAALKALAPCNQISYFDPNPSSEYLAITSLPINAIGEVTRTVILGSGQTVYSSPENLYITRSDWNYQPIRDTDKPDTQDRESTLIYRFALNNGRVEHQAKGRVPGSILNQFSMDEYGDSFRIATTKGNMWDSRNPSTNNIYVLGRDLKQRGKIEGIAPGERIYSVRFMGKRGYMVTFKKIDPFFVFDLANPSAPKMLGKLKIPGYSDYLHPMDENHVIGIGKNATEAEGQNFAWYQGMKLAVFDVTDVENPKEKWKTEIGDRGTDSPALHDHKAFLYSPAKQLLALPITLAEIDPALKVQTDRRGSEYGEFTFQGAYVYRLTTQKGFELLGRISHQQNDDRAKKSGWYWYGGDDDVNRIGYIGDSLMTVSNGKLQFNTLYNLTKQSEVAYPKIDLPEVYPVDY